MREIFNSLLNNIEKNGRRLTAAVLSVLITVCSINMSGFAAYAADRTSYSNTLNGWKVASGWGNLSDSCEWNAETQGTQSYKMIVTYRVENTDHVDKETYAPGEVVFRVPGLGNANRASVKKASALPSDSSTSEWNCTWDEVSDVYTFTNKVVMDAQSINGGFEVMWSLTARDTIDHYSQARSVEFELDGESITLPPLYYDFTSVRDVVKIGRYDQASDSWKLRTNRLGAADYEASDKDYVWYTVYTDGTTNYKARALYYSNYYVTLDLPEGAEAEDVVIKLSDGSTVSLDENNGFYVFTNRRGDIGGNGYISQISSFQVGLRKETFSSLGSSADPAMVTINGHLDRLYNDDEEWVTENLVAEDNVDASVSVTYQDYYYEYDHVYIPATHDYYYAYDRGYNKTTPYHYSTYSQRMLNSGIYNGKILNFSFGGNFGVSLRDNGTPEVDYTTTTLVLVEDEDEDSQGAAGLMSASPKRAMSLALKPADTATGSDADYMPDGRLLDISDVIKDEDLLNPEAGFDDWNDLKWSANGLDEQDNDVQDEGVTFAEVKGTQADNSEEEPSEDEPLLDGLIDAVTSLFETEVEAAEIASPSNSVKTESSGPAEGTRSLSGAKGVQQSIIDKDLTWDLMTGDDKMIVYLNDGTIRDVEPSEYDMLYVTLPQSVYPVEVYYTTDPDGGDGSSPYYDDYILVRRLDRVSSETTVEFPSGTKAVFIRVCDITGAFYYYPKLGVRFHFDREAEALKEYEKQVDNEGMITNFAYFRMLYTAEEDGEEIEINDIPSSAEAYRGTYGPTLAERDYELYGEYPARMSDNIYLREAYSYTWISTDISLNSFTGNSRNGFRSTVTASGSIHTYGDEEIAGGEINRFTLYSLTDEALYTPDNADFSITGIGYDLNGNRVDINTEITNVFDITYDGKHGYAFEVDMGDDALDPTREINIRVSYPVTLSGTDFQSFGNQYAAESFLQIQEGVFDELRGSQLRQDTEDIDTDGDTAEKIAYDSDSKIVYDSVSEWREYVSKYVRSVYSDGYTNETVARLDEYDVDADEKEKAASDYSYRLDFGLGSTNAKNITFYDRIETGAKVARENDPNTYDIFNSEWQGRLVSVDTSRPEAMGMTATVYYSEDDQQEFDLEAGGWSTEAPADMSDVKSIAVHLDTNALPDGLMKMKQMTYIVINMRAPSDRNAVDKTAINQGTVVYDAYDVMNQLDAEGQVLPSSETRVKMLDSVGKMTLQKVDGDDVVRTGQNGEPVYRVLTGAMFSIYDANGNVLADSQAVNSLGRITLKNMPYGTYYYEETAAPKGYKKLTGTTTIVVEGVSHQVTPFTLDGTQTSIDILNERIRGVVTLTKNDADHVEYGPLEGAEYELYTAAGDQVMFNSDRNYDEDGAIRTVTTGADGTITVRNLPWGSYYFLETAAPDGYELSGAHTSFTIDRNTVGLDEYENEIVVRVSHNDEEKTAGIRLKKQDEEDGKALRDAYFSLYRQNAATGNWIKISSGHKTNAAGEIEIEDLKFGEYKLVETQAPKGYRMPTDPEGTGAVYFTLDAETADSVVEKVQTNSRIMGTALVRKYAEDGEGRLEGAEYALYREDGTLVKLDDNMTVDEEGTLESFLTNEYGESEMIKGLSWGTYYFKETAAPKGYDIDDSTLSFTITKENASSSLPVVMEAVNNRTRGAVTLSKYDEATKAILLPGAEFALYMKDGTRVRYADAGAVAEFIGKKNDLLALGISERALAITNEEIDDEKAYKATILGTATSLQEIHDNDNGVTITGEITRCYKVSRDAAENVNETFVTDQNGQFRVEGLDWGTYYFEETKAPAGYGLSSDKIQFVVSLGNCAKNQQLTCYDPVKTGTIRIRKAINEQYDAFGTPVFIFRVTGQDIGGKDHRWTSSITMNGTNSGEALITEVPAGTYQVQELPVGRYVLDEESVSVLPAGTVADGIATVTITDDDVEVSFDNTMTQYEKFSHTANATNVVNTKRKLTAMAVEYAGPNPITESTEGVEDSHTYQFKDGDIVATAYYDDGSTKVLSFSELILTDENRKVTGDDNPGKLVAVSYAEDGIIVMDNFTVELTLAEPPHPRYVTYDARGGTFNGEEEINRLGFVWKNGEITKIVHTDNLDDEGNWDGVTPYSYVGAWTSSQDSYTLQVEGASPSNLLFRVFYDFDKSEYISRTWIGSQLSYSLDGGSGWSTLSGTTEAGELRESSGRPTNGSDKIVLHWKSSNTDDVARTRYGWYATLTYNGLGNIPYSGKYMEPERAGKVFMGWYTDPECTDGNEYEYKDLEELTEDITVYAKWRDQYAETGSRFKSSISSSATSFKRYEGTPDFSTISTTRVDNQSTSDVPIYMWYDSTTRTQYWWCELDTIYISETYGCSSMFSSKSNMVNIDLSGIDFSKATGMSSMFSYCSKLETIEFGDGFNTSNVTNMDMMFYQCKKLTSFDATVFDTSNVTSMNYMFYYCQRLTTLDLTSFDTSQVSNMSYMFCYCTSLTSVDLSSFDTSVVTNMSYMFRSDSALTTIYASELWNTDNVTTHNNMFTSCSNLPNWSSSYVDKTNAHYNSGGYLTYKAAP